MLKVLDRLDPTVVDSEGWPKEKEVWKSRQDVQWKTEEAQRSFVAALVRIACSRITNAESIKGIVRNLPYFQISDKVSEFSAAIQDTKKCRNARMLAESDRLLVGRLLERP